MTKRIHTTAIALLALVLAFAALAPGRVALADDSADNLEITINGVSDYVTQVNFEKLVQGGDDYVVGATLQVADVETGEIIDTWTTTDEESHPISKKLIVGRTYVLRELSAPDGYEVASEVQFYVNATDGEIIFIGDVDETNAATNGKNTLMLYDKKLTNEQEVWVEQEREAPLSNEYDNSYKNEVPLSQTGDDFDPALWGGVALMGAGAVAMGLLVASQRREEE